MSYDLVYTIMQAARGRLNDAIESTSAIDPRILKSGQFFTQQMVNNAFRRLQEKLADFKYSGIETETTFLNLPAVGSTDPISQCLISQTGYFDGNANHPGTTLPTAIIRPYKMWERQNGLNPPGQMYEMDEVEDGLPSVPKNYRSVLWSWTDDALYFTGSIVNTDLRMRYAQYFPDFVDNSPLASTPWYAQTVPILRCQDPFADYICREFEIARQQPDAALAFQTSAEQGCQLLANRDLTEPGSLVKPSEKRKMKDQYTPTGMTSR